MPPSGVVDDAELAQAVRARPRPLAGVVGFLNKLVFSLTMLTRDLAEVTRRVAIPVGVVLVATLFSVSSSIDRSKKIQKHFEKILKICL